MAALKVHDEGWLVLPTGLRLKLGLKSGDQLEAELVRGTIVLRRAGRTASPQVLPDEPKAEAAAAPIAGEPKPTSAAASTATAEIPPAARQTKRKPAQAILPAALKSRGRRKGKDAAEGPTNQS
jgi:AbrB family looped-hinge helix DNA binding protein